jgi:peptidoglycan/xylan/chitin deacetylase (PgdA/CDA1 family)
MNIRQIIYLGVVLIGVLWLALVPTNDLIRGAVIHYGWRDVTVIVLGAICTILGLTLFNIERSKVISPKPTPWYRRMNILAVLMLCGLILSMTYVGSLYGQLQTHERMVEKLTREKSLQGSPFENMACKKVIIRNDDVFKVDPILEWLSNLTVSKNIKMTYAVIPARLQNHPQAIAYLSNLDKKHFEMATHGYAHVKRLQGIPYGEQYSLIEAGTKIMEDCFHARPYTFIPPHSSDDINTVRVCKALGYHSISSASKAEGFLTSYAADFADIDFCWESDFSTHPVRHHTYDDFKGNFDRFYASTDIFYVAVLHHATFCEESGRVNEAISSQFEESIDYMKSTDVQFMTIEEAYQWYVDADDIRWGQINDNDYFVDLATCQYDHMIKFNCPVPWPEEMRLIDISTGEESGIYKSICEFNGIKGHCYEIVGSVSR